MPQSLPYARLVHADWSTSPRKRWAATAARTNAGWLVEAPKQIADTKRYLEHLFDEPAPTLAGFDFPIGLPEHYGKATGLPGFCGALDTFGRGIWSDFYNPAETPGEISVHRPFYPQRSSSGARQLHLTEGLGSASMHQLLRRCEQASATRRAACAVFWTLGANQVGKAAISGWQEIVGPAHRLGAKIWPFEGSLTKLAEKTKLTLAETYPAEAYGHVGARFLNGQSKRRQGDRGMNAGPIGTWASLHRIALTTELTSLIADGFGPRPSGEDPFDAVLGLLGMIEVVEGRRPSGETNTSDNWEGWILGQIADGD
jgi:hypothetical protein